MKTLWDLIYAWKGQLAEAERIKAKAEEARAEAKRLDGLLRAELATTGPVTNGTEVFLLSMNRKDPICVLPLTDAIKISLTESETTNP